MIMKKTLDHKRIRRLIWLVLTIFVLSSHSVLNTAGSVYYSLPLQPYATVTNPPVVLEDGNCSGTSTIYTNKTSAKVNVEAPLFDYVDNVDSNVDSNVDKGVHSNFTAQQAGPDSIYDMLTERSGEIIEDYIDNNISDMDNSTDVGTHSNFENQKYYDSIYDTLTEADTGSSQADNNVDSEILTHGDLGGTSISDAQTVNDVTENMTEGSEGADYNAIVLNLNPNYRWLLDGDETDSVDGAHSDGGNDPSWVANIIPNNDTTLCGDYDGTNDETLIPNQNNINVDVTYEKSISVWIVADVIDTSGGGRVIWGEGGPTNGLGLYVYYEGGENRLYACVYETTNIDYCYTTISTDTLYHIGLTLDTNADELILYLNGTQVASDTSLAMGSGGFASHQAGISIGQVDYDMNNHNDATLNGFFNGRISDVVYWAEQDVLTADNMSDIYNAGITGTDYQLDIEHVVNSIGNYENYNLTTRAYRTAENFYLQLYNFTYSQWVNMSTVTASSLTWYNITFVKAHFVNATNHARIRYWQGIDGTAETLYVDYSGIYGWNVTNNYELDLEIQFTAVIDFLPTKTLCINTGTFLGTENINVDSWNGTGWENLATDLTANSWNNYTVSVTSTTFTIRFRDGTTDGDATQDQWQIDASLLRVEGAGSKEDAVDNDTSNVDSYDDVGILSNFDNMKTKDGMANLTEGAVSGTVWLWQEDTSGYTPTSSYETFQFWSSWTTNSTTSGTVTKIGIYVFADPGNSPQVKLGIYDDSGGSPNNLLGETNAATITGAGWLDLDIVGGGVDISASTTYHIAHITNIAPITQWRYLKTTTSVSDYRNGRVWPNLFDPAGATTKSLSYRYGAYRVGYDTRALDQEVQWTGIPYLLPNETLCIYGGTMGDEDIKVDAWNGTGWETVFDDLSSGWNNMSVTDWLTTSNFTIRFKDGAETGDPSQDTWQIDVALIHIWNEAGENYELDLEVQWTNVDYDETNEELCIYYYEGNNTHSLDATGGYMIVGDGTPDWGSTTGTISFWIKMDSSVQGRFWGQDTNMETRWSGTNLVLDWGATGSMTSAYSFSADTWYFVAIVWDENNDNLFLYIGDENNPPTLDANSLNGTWTSTTPAPTENRFMNGLGGNQPVDGHGDELRYWSIARSLTEIQSDYNTELTGSEPSLRSYFKLNNNFDDIGPDNNDGSSYDGYSFSSDVAFEAPPTENILVDVWYSGSWQSLFGDLSSGWNNVSVSSYLTSSNFTIRFKGGNETSDTTQDSWNIDVTLLHVWTTETYDYVLKVVNQVAKNWAVNLQVYDSSNISRLSSLNMSLHDGTSSNQIAISGGSMMKSEGEPYNLPGGFGSTIYISMSNLQATTSDNSYLYVYLKIQIPSTSTYFQYAITFKIK